MNEKSKKIIVCVVGIVVIILIATTIGVLVARNNNQGEVQNINVKDSSFGEEDYESTDEKTDNIDDGEIIALRKPGNVLSNSERFTSKSIPYTETKYQTLVKDYSLNADLSNIENLDSFTNLNEEQLALLKDNGFVVSPTKNSQLCYIYEDNTYNMIPSFITTDSVLHVYHIFYDYSLRNIENDSLYDAITQLNINMLDELINEYNSVTNNEVKQNILSAIGYFGVSQLAYGKKLPDNFPDEIKEIVNKENSLIEKAAGFAESPLLKKELDYSLFTPRGHYTRSEKLKKYFKGTSWYGNAFFEMLSSSGQVDNESVIRTIIIANALNKLEPNCGVNLWNGIYSTTSFFVGNSDDITPKKIIEIMEKVYGKNVEIDKIGDEKNLSKFVEEIKKLPKAKIDSEGTQGVQFRFMGQRYVPDSEILQKLVKSEYINPDTGKREGRVFPNGLDVMSVLGSDRAKYLNEKYYDPVGMWPKYSTIFASLREKFSGLSRDTWESNMYYAWLNTLKSLNKEYGQGYPMFMRNNAWQDKSLATALSGWAELRHDTILYAKQSYAAECGGGGDEEEQEVPVVRGYVEPNVEFYDKLLWLTKYSRTNLNEMDLLSKQMQYKMESLETMLQFLKECSIKELKNEELSRDDYDQLLTYGGWLEEMILSFGNERYYGEEDEAWYEITSTTDENMALIADVHTARYKESGNDQYLEEAIGNAAEIYVVVPINGKLYITRGSTFDYFEFISDKRMTDEEWQKVAGNNSYRPEWTKSFMESKRETSEELSSENFVIRSYSSGC